MKKHILTLSVLAAALLLLPCCSKDQNPDLVGGSNNFIINIKAEMEKPTPDSGEKTHLGPTDNGKTPILWSKDDHISLFDGTSTLDFALESGENTASANFSCQGHLDATASAYCAFYPIDMNPTAQLNNDSYTVTFQLPQTQNRKPADDGTPTLAEGALPMIAYANSTDNEFNFRTPMAILKVDLIGTGWVDKMVLTDLDESTQLWGLATVTVSDETAAPEIHSENLSGGNNTLTLDCLHARLNESTPTSFYFVVPVGTLCDENGQGFTVDVYDLDNHCFTINESDVHGGFIQRATISTLAHDEMMDLDNITGIKGLFSVSEDKQVFFSQGNLWCDWGDWFPMAKCYFEAHQYESPDSWNPHHASLFLWYHEFYLQDYITYSTASYFHPNIEDVFFTNSRNEDGTELPNPNFGVNINGTSQDGIWRTLSTEEWMYLFSYKWDGANSYYDDYDNNARRGMYRKGVTVMGHTNCIVLYPDGYDGEKVEDFDTGTFNVESAYNEATAAGIVFLPAAGYRNNSTNVECFGSRGAYWSSTPNPGAVGYAHALYFQSLEDKAGWKDRYVNPKGDLPRSYGCSLRLVRDITIPAN